MMHTSEAPGSTEEYGTSTLWGSAFADKLSGCSPGEQVVIEITGFLSEIAKDRIVVEVIHCETKEDVKDVDSAYKRAKNAQEYLKLHQEPSVG